MRSFSTNWNLVNTEGYYRQVYHHFAGSESFSALHGGKCTGEIGVLWDVLYNE